MININATHEEGTYFYMLFCLAAIVLIIAGAGMAARKSTFTFRELILIVCISIPSAIIGSKLLLFDGAQWMTMFSEGHLPVVNGKSITGVIIGVMFGAWVAGRICGKKESILDLIAISFPLGMAVQRFGCLVAGCCHGSITSMPLGITYGPGSKPFMQQVEHGNISIDAVTSLPVHPDQIYNILACGFIAFIAWKTRSHWKSPSGKFIFTIILYLSFRFVEEFLRFKLQPEEWMGLQADSGKFCPF